MCVRPVREFVLRFSPPQLQIRDKRGWELYIGGGQEVGGKKYFWWKYFLQKYFWWKYFFAKIYLATNIVLQKYFLWKYFFSENIFGKNFVGKINFTKILATIRIISMPKFEKCLKIFNIEKSFVSTQI